MNKGHNPKKSVLGSSSDGDGFCSSEPKHDRRTVPRPNLFCFFEKITETKATT
jgi:hypothetical protein